MMGNQDVVLVTETPLIKVEGEQEVTLTVVEDASEPTPEEEQT